MKIKKKKVFFIAVNCTDQKTKICNKTKFSKRKYYSKNKTNIFLLQQVN